MAFTLADAVVFISGSDKQLEKDLDGAEKKTGSAVGNMTKLIGGALVASAALAGTAILAIGKSAWDVATDIDGATDQIGASLGLTADEAAKFGDVIKAVYADNFGDSIEDVGTAVEIVAKQLKLAADDPALPKLTSNAFRLRDVFKVDVTQSVDAVKTLMDNFGKTSEEAFDFIATGFQRGLDRSGDFLETIGEYTVQFEGMGFSAEEMFSILETGAQGGVLGLDKIADAIKEMGIILNEGTPAARAAFASMGMDYDLMAAEVSTGNTEWADYFDTIIGGLNDIDDPLARSQAQVAILGTMAEDLGPSFTEGLSSATASLGDMAGATDALDIKYTSLGSVIEGMWRKFQVGIAPAGEAMLGFVNDNLPAIQAVVDEVSAKVVEFIVAIPAAIAGIKQTWDDDWGGMRTTVTEFATAVPIALQEMWDEIDKMFQREGDKTGDGWKNFWGSLSSFFVDWVLVVLDSWTEALRSIRSLFGAISALLKGDWEGFWDGMYNYVDSISNQILNFIEFWFGPNLRNKFAGALNGVWETLNSWWGKITEFWNSTIGTIPGMGQIGGGSGDVSGFGETVPQRSPVEQFLEDLNVTQPQSFSGLGGTSNRTTTVEAGAVVIQGVATTPEALAAFEEALVAILEREA